MGCFHAFCRKFGYYQVFVIGLMGLTGVGAYCAYVHDCGHASDRELEGPLLVFGHFEGVLVLDIIVISLLSLGLVLSLLPFRSYSTSGIPQEQTPQQQTAERWVRRLECLLMLLASVCLAIEFTAELAIVRMENQRRLTTPQMTAEIVLVALTGITFLCCMFTTCIRWPDAPVEKGHAEVSPVLS